ncbi:MAG: DNA alkylation repair protein [Candidatus Diapherotrites archaeon]
MDCKGFLKEISFELNSNADPKFAKGMKGFFKEKINPIGVRRPITRKIANEFFKEHRNDFSFNEWILLSEEFLKSPVMEMQDIGFFLAEKQKKNFTKNTFDVFEFWLKKYVSNWVHCDELCPHCIGPLIELCPDLIPKISSWASSNNRWLRRASMVSYVLIARKKDYSKEVIFNALNLLNDKDDLVHKAVGWTLRESAKANKKAVYEFLKKNKLKFPRTALRYAIEKFSEKEKKELMEK